MIMPTSMITHRRRLPVAPTQATITTTVTAVMILLQFLQLTTIRMDMVIPTIMDMVMVMHMNILTLLANLRNVHKVRNDVTMIEDLLLV